MQAIGSEQSEQDGLYKFIRFLYKDYKEITSLKKLQQLLESSFEQNFRPEADQIDHLRKL